MSFPEFVNNNLLAWSCAGFLAVIAVCSLFRSRLGFDALLLRLDAEAIAQQADIIKKQTRLLAVQKKLIETLRQQLRIEGVVPWDDPTDED